MTARAKTWGKGLALVTLLSVLAPAAACQEIVTEHDSWSCVERRYERTTLFFAPTPDITFAEIDRFPPNTNLRRTVERR